MTTPAGGSKSRVIATKPLRIAVFALSLILLLMHDARAITISVAKIDKGAVQVKGKQAQPLALLTWEGQPVAQASKSGTFRFETTTLPNDCVGTLSDGNHATPVVIQYCGPVGPRGPQGATGAVGQCYPGPANPTPTPGGATTMQTVDFDFSAANPLQAFQVRVAYSTAKGSFSGSAENVSCVVTGGGGIFTRYDNDAAGTLTLSVANTSNLIFPINIECSFNATSGITPNDFTVVVQEVTQNNGPGSTSDLLVSISVS